MQIIDISSQLFVFISDAAEIARSVADPITNPIFGTPLTLCSAIGVHKINFLEMFI